VDGQKRGVVRVGVGEEKVDLAPVGLRGQLVELGGQVGLDGGVGFSVEELGEVAGVASPAVELVPRLQLVAQPRGVLVERPGAARVLPEVGGGELLLQLAQA
jgi:hypothetical protein